MADKTKGLLVEIGADTSKFSAAMRKLHQPIKDAQTAVKQLDKALKIDPKNATLIDQKFKYLEKSVDGAKGKIDEIRAAMQKLESEGKVDTEQYRRLQRELVLAEAEYRKLTADAIKFKVEQSAIGRSAAWAQNMAPKLDAIGNKFMKLTKAAAGFGVALGGIAIAKAFRKLESLEETRSIFVGLGKSADEVTAIMDDVTNSVSGTKYALADMAKVAKGALGGGADQKYGLANYLSRVGDLAAFTGGSVDQFGTIMNKALSKGTVDARLLNQMLAGGIPIYTDLAASMGVSQTELSKLIRAGKVGFDDLFKATEKYQGLATKTAMSTVGGAITILGQRWTNVGVAFLEGAYEPLRGGLIKLADYLAKNMDKVKEWGRAFGDAIKYLIKYARTGESDLEGLSDKAQKFAKVLQPIVGFVAKVVRAFMDLSASGKKAVAFFALATGPIMKLSAGMLRIYSRSADVVKGFTLMKQGGMTLSQTMAQADNGTQKFGAALGKLIPISGGLFASLSAGVGVLAAVGIGLKLHLDKIHEATRAYKDFVKANEDEIKSIEAQGRATDSLFNRLQILNEIENKNTSQKKEMKAIVEQLNEAMPDLGLTYDENTDKLNKSTDAIKEHIEQSKEMAKQKAYIKQSEKAWEKYVEAEQKYYKARDKYEAELAKGTSDKSAKSYEQRKQKLAELETQMNDAKAAMDGYEQSANQYADTAYKDAAATANFKNTQKTLVNEIKNSAGQLPTFVNGTLRSVTTMFRNSGKNNATQYANGMKGSSGLVGAAAKAMATNAKSGSSVNLTPEGRNAAQGFINGIKSLLKVSYNTGATLANKAKQGAKDALKERSPSRVMKEVGEYFGEGFAIGISSSIPQAVNAANRMANASVMAMNSVPVNNSNSIANEVSGAVASSMLIGNSNVPENINVVVELGGAKVGETIVNLVKTTGNALYAEGV